MANARVEQPTVRLGAGGGGRLTGESAQHTASTLRRLLRYLKPYRRQMLLVAFFVIASTVLKLIGPYLLSSAIDDSIIPRDGAGLARISLWMLAVYLAAGAISAVQSLIMVVIGQKFVADIRRSLFSHMQRLSMGYHDRHKVGDLMSRVSNDTEAINSVLTNGLIEFVSNILLLGGTMIAMFFLSWPLALAMVVVLSLMLYITGEVTRRSRQAFRNVQSNLGNLNAVTEEAIAGIRVVKAFARERDSLAEYQRVNAANREAGIKADIIVAVLGPMFTTMSTITIAVTALLGGWLALRGLTEVGVLAAFVVYIMNFFRPMRAIAMLYNQLQSALAGSERIFAVLDTESAVQDSANAHPLPRIQGEVVFDNVSFGYEEGKPVLVDVSLKAEPGQTIALVGPTGAGKTTVVNLLSRFYDVTGGRITIDGFDIREIQQVSLRSQLGIVLQDTFLFSGSVLENIRYGRLDATDEEVVAAARLANADRFIRLLPEGYATQVSEQGHNFSEGQRQLLAIARAILADPRILILDEATSSVDTRTEIQIQEALLRLLEGRTAFVIAHRLSTIRKADQVLVVNDHHIIERGTHEELLARRGFYHDLYMSQYRRVAAGTVNGSSPVP
jgi:ATP-binding cassette, subfamily B, multidrug efflux pump